MEQSELLAAVRRPLSPDTLIEVQASREEYDHVLDMLEGENIKYVYTNYLNYGRIFDKYRFPRIQYDGTRQVAIVVAAPGPVHGQMVESLIGSISDAVATMPDIDANIKHRLSGASSIDKGKIIGHCRRWTFPCRKCAFLRVRGYHWRLHPYTHPKQWSDPSQTCNFFPMGVV
ncbi:hypothetical protein V1504DRAFT_457329 [Lipomyces starkeyi]